MVTYNYKVDLVSISLQGYYLFIANYEPFFGETMQKYIGNLLLSRSHESSGPNKLTHFSYPPGESGCYTKPSLHTIFWNWVIFELEASAVKEFTHAMLVVDTGEVA